MEAEKLTLKEGLSAQESIYGAYEETLRLVMEDIFRRIRSSQKEYEKTHGGKIAEHLDGRIKEEGSMRDKLAARGLPINAHSALREVTDAVGIRIVCGFRDDIYANLDCIRSWDQAKIVQEKDYVRHAKGNGYRSYHVILDVEEPYMDVDGNCPGHFYVEIQLRTIAMDSWAALEHEISYKQGVSGNARLIETELKRCADELASCDVTMQTIRDLIRHENAKSEEESHENTGCRR